MAAARKVVLITGANGGLGYEAVRAFLESPNPYHIFLGSRSVEKGNTAVETLRKECSKSSNTVELLQVDVSTDDSIEKAYKQVEASQGRVDTLVNNAGINTDMDFVRGEGTLRESFTKAYNVNVAGAHVMTWTFMPLLLKSTDPRLIFVTGLSQITVAAEKYFPTPPQPAGWPKNIDFETIGYRASKCALNMIVLDWNHKLKADGVKVWGLGPGMLATGLGNVSPEILKRMDLAHPSQGATFIRDVAEGERDADVGKLVGRGRIIPF